MNVHPVKVRLGTVVASIVLAACNISSSPPQQGPGTKRMAARLEEIARNLNPATNTYINDARVEYLRQLDLPSDPVDRLRLQVHLAREFLRAGQSQEAIDRFLSLKQQLGATKTKPSVHKLLALAYLRLGEQDNCLQQHTSESCLFPISQAGVHDNQRGARAALGEFTVILRDDPGEMTARWLLNIAYMLLGEYPDSVPSQWLIPPTAFVSDGDIGRFGDVAPQLGLDVVSLAGGSIAEDFDRDGDLDIMASSWGLRDQLRYFRNRGDGTFDDVTAEAGLNGVVGGLQIVHADYDNNGFADVLVLRGAWWEEDGRHPNSLLHNYGDSFFDDVTAEAGLLAFYPTQTAAWGDYDNDGWIDLFIGNESFRHNIHPCQLFHNQGDGTFADVAQEAGVAVSGYVKGVVWGDYDNDGRLDLYISRLTAPNLLFRNEGENTSGQWTFADATAQAGVAEPVWSFPAWFWDYDNDGWLDLFVSGYHANAGDLAAEYLGLPHDAEYPRLYRNQGDGTFADVTFQVGLDKVLYTMGCNFGDLDNDGWPDFYAGTGSPSFRSVMPNRMFRNAGGQLFQEVTTSGGFGHLQKGHGVSFGDLDNDGDQDIYAVIGGSYTGDLSHNVLFENPGHGNHWLTLQLQGVHSNRAAIGARIRVGLHTKSGRRDIYAAVTAGASFGGSSLQQEIGLGQATAIESVAITWPASGETQLFTDLAMDRAYKIREGDPVPTPVELQAFDLSPADTDVARAGRAHHP